MKKQVSNYIFGLVLIIIGIIFAGNSFLGWDIDIFFKGWWTLFIIIPALISIFEEGPRTLNIFALIIGILFFLDAQHFMRGIDFFDLAFPLIFIYLGIRLIVRSGRKNTNKNANTNTNYNTNNNANYHDAHTNQSQSGTDIPNFDAVFSDEHVNFNGNPFYGANVSSSFASNTLHLDGAIINGDVTIRCNASFGAIKICCPANVNVTVSPSSFFGGVSNKRNVPYIDGAPTIHIDASCAFGGIEIY
ncbi:MAG: cell wall-active antibiotics response protein [Lachnospiraceae bacterium]|nr:cell wall-active antibiotics response protein [Lachnospiraceae bacterium]